MIQVTDVVMQLVIFCRILLCNQDNVNIHNGTKLKALNAQFGEKCNLLHWLYQ